MLIKQLPNCITVIRIIGTVLLFFIPPLSISFYVVYSICGISDVADGFIARKMKTTSSFGAKLDSIADLLFYAVMLYRIFPILWRKLPGWIWYVVAGILILRFCSYLVAALKYKRFASLHTYLNKLTGFMIFSVPYLLDLPIIVAFCIGVCVVAAIASGEELFLHLSSKEYDPTQKTLLCRMQTKKT